MKVQRSLAGLVTGALFGFGLAVSQMTDPEKVLSFLRWRPGWDASLLMTMAAAVPVTLLGYRWAMGKQPIFDSQHYLPTNRLIDVRLVVGAVIFGIGWGLAGYCPGPALTALGSGFVEPAIFVGAMVAGSQIGRLAD